MSKILYPVGTPVLLKADEPNNDPLYVVEYRKGKKFPYGLSATPHGPVQKWGDGKEHKWFSVKGLKRYNPKELRSADSVDVSPTQAKVDQGNTVKQPETSACNCYTAEEVDVLLAKQWEAIVQMLSNVDGVAMEALRNIHMIADMTDSNFRKVAKQFKTLNHDDD